MPSTTTTELPVRIDVTPDKLSVRVSLRLNRAAKTPDAPDIIAHLTKLGVTLTRRGEAEIQELCRPRKTGLAAQPAVVATGKLPVDDQPAQLALLPSMSRSIFEPREVKAGESVAVLVPRRSGSDGVDVFGKSIPRKQAGAVPKIDPSLALCADGRTYAAAICGVVRVRGEGADKTIAVLPCLRIKKDVCRRSLISAGQIIVEGNVSSATLQAGGMIHIDGDLENSTATCNDDLVAENLRNVRIASAGDCIASSVLQSRIACCGKLQVNDGSIVGGYVIAGGGVDCKSLGSPSFMKTVVEIGIEQNLRQRLVASLPEIRAKIESAQKIRRTVNSLLRSPPALNPQQESHVAALLAEAEALEQSVRQQRSDLQDQYQSAVSRCHNEISIAQIVHPNVTIRFSGMQTTVRIALQGPCVIRLDAESDKPRIVLSPNGRSAIPLETCMLNEDWRTAAKQLSA